MKGELSAQSSKARREASWTGERKLKLLQQELEQSLRDELVARKECSQLREQLNHRQQLLLEARSRIREQDSQQLKLVRLLHQRYAQQRLLEQRVAATAHLCGRAAAAAAAATDGLSDSASTRKMLQQMDDRAYSAFVESIQQINNRFATAAATAAVSSSSQSDHEISSHCHQSVTELSNSWSQLEASDKEADRAIDNHIISIR